MATGEVEEVEEDEAVPLVWLEAEVISHSDETASAIVIATLALVLAPGLRLDVTALRSRPLVLVTDPVGVADMVDVPPLT